MPIDRYLSAADMRLEQQRLWPRVWQLAALESDLREPGAYVTYEIGADSVLVVRQAHGLRAFHNVCRHRGRQLCEPGTGTLEVIRCPFHHWQWSLDGTLRSIPQREAFPCLPEDGALGLHELAVEVFGGLVFVHFDREASPLVDYLGPLAPLLAAYRLQDYALVVEQSKEIACNWKVSVEGNEEGYHIPMLHPELLDAYDDSTGVLVEHGLHAHGGTAFGSPAQGRPERAGPLPLATQGALREAGIDPASYKGTAAGARHAIQQTLRARTDFDFGGLTDDQLSDYHHFFVFPNLALNLYGLRLILSRHRPHATDPQSMVLDQLVFDRIPRGAARPPRPAPQRFRPGEGSLGMVTDQDVENFERLQRGMRSTVVNELVLGEQERSVRSFIAHVEHYVRGAGN